MYAIVEQYQHGRRLPPLLVTSPSALQTPLSKSWYEHFSAAVRRFSVNSVGDF
jgi:hypothetical protein